MINDIAEWGSSDSDSYVNSFQSITDLRTTINTMKEALY